MKSICAELDLPPERLMCAGLINNEQTESEQKPSETDLHAIDPGCGIGHSQAVGRIIRRNQDVRV